MKSTSSPGWGDCASFIDVRGQIFQKFFHIRRSPWVWTIK